MLRWRCRRRQPVDAVIARVVIAGPNMGRRVPSRITYHEVTR